MGAVTLLCPILKTLLELAEPHLEQQDESAALHLPALPLC